MKIVLIGSGNVATVLGKLIKEAGHHIVQVISRNLWHAQQLGELLNADFSTDIRTINSAADIYIIATADDAITEVAGTLQLHNKIVLHTSGAISKDVLQVASENYGVLYPLQSLRKELTYTPVIPLLIDANNATALAATEVLAASLSSKVSVADDAQRVKLHIAAVITANFSNHLFALTESYCKTEAVPFDMLVPLLQETANRLTQFSPKEMQTGPAERGDVATIHKHLQMLQSYPQLKKLYEVMSKSISDFKVK